MRSHRISPRDCSSWLTRSTCTTRSLRRAALSRETQVLYDEVDINHDGDFAHRILFWPSEEATIPFRSFALTTCPVPDKRVNVNGAFSDYEDEDEDAGELPDPP